MSETKHTPGPWRYIGLEIAADFVSIAVMRQWSDEVQAELQANACLIAAAPEMLEALRDTVDLELLREDWVHKVQAAIAKAEGKL